jgi:hypothetical protein
MPKRSTKRLRFRDRARLGILKSRVVDGFWLGALDNDALDRVIEALRVIQTFDPNNYRRLRFGIERIVVTVILEGNAAQYVSELGLCELDERFVKNDKTSPEIIASAIIHESTHARLHHLGFKYEEAKRRRHELICIHRELAFVSRLPNGQAARESIEFRLNNMFDLTDAAFVERRLTGEREAARYAGIPDWLVTAVLGLRRGVSNITRASRSIFR